MDSAAVMPPNAGWRLDDSKRLSHRQREAADAGLRSMTLSFSLGWVTAGEIDDIGLSAAVGLAMRRALAGLHDDYDRIIIDGNSNYLSDNSKAEAVVKADGSVPAVSAASIIAKVARDKWMAAEAASLYPGYGFERHVGYGTKLHQAALARLGPCELHRRSFKPIRAYSL